MVANVLSPASITEETAQADQLMGRQIRHSLAELRRPALGRLTVEVQGGRVTLRGRVATFYEKQLAMHSCQDLLGSGRLVDRVEVA